MAISQDLLDILVCPVCKAPLGLTPNKAGLQCHTCRRVYPIRDEIPGMLVEETSIPKQKDTMPR